MAGKDYGLVDKNSNFPLSGTHLDTITVKIAPAGTLYSNEFGEVSHSRFGHAWVEFQGESIGWGTGESKEVGGADNITFKDSVAYDKQKVTSITYPLYTDQVIKNIENYLADIINGFFDGEFGSFSKDYHLIDNNCIKFVNSILAITRESDDSDNVDAIPDLMGISPDLIIESFECQVQAFKEMKPAAPFDFIGDDIIYFAENNVLIFEADEAFSGQNEGALELFALWRDTTKENLTDNIGMYVLDEFTLPEMSVIYIENDSVDTSGNGFINWSGEYTIQTENLYFEADKMVALFNSTIDVVGVNNNFDDLVL
ncbi:hypothetical protein [Xenorhabdus szentirmaii]|uniref:hypothetical protein n=1 Tax=Xenorhabdus szentirmaii TaxID=290112 RepID=UPI00199FBE22|nr:MULTISPECIES: hypothetical protein [unclassified Xenorhabdus]MBD2793031.1 hypothetical protein [Xenorhabdus sp. CUL]MBD2824490.1 hypothetical protein [Xenorhabdus sp. 5]